MYRETHTTEDQYSFFTSRIKRNSIFFFNLPGNTSCGLRISWGAGGSCSSCRSVENLYCHRSSIESRGTWFVILITLYSNLCQVKPSKQGNCIAVLTFVDYIFLTKRTIHKKWHLQLPDVHCKNFLHENLLVWKSFMFCIIYMYDAKIMCCVINTI